MGHRKNVIATPVPGPVRNDIRAEPIIAEGLQTQKQFAEDVLKGLSEEERAGCIRAFRKIHQNADECLKKHKGAKL